MAASRRILHGAHWAPPGWAGLGWAGLGWALQVAAAAGLLVAAVCSPQCCYKFGQIVFPDFSLTKLQLFPHRRSTRTAGVGKAQTIKRDFQFVSQSVRQFVSQAIRTATRSKTGSSFVDQSVSDPSTTTGKTPVGECSCTRCLGLAGSVRPHHWLLLS